MTEVQSRIKILQEENKDLRKRLASNEKEIANYRARLENIEAEIAALEEEQGVFPNHINISLYKE